MSAALPEGVDPDDEIAVTWEVDDDVTTISLGFGNSEITMRYPATEHDAAMAFALAQMLPLALEQLATAMDEEETQP